MKFLKNFRRGFATNSSSSHSFVYMKSPNTALPQEGISVDGDFGWNDFRLDAIKEKLFYVLVDRVGVNSWETPTDDEVLTAMEAHGKDFPEFDTDDFREAIAGYVDHDSKGLISLEQARDPYVAVFGGNDNSDGSDLRRAAVAEIDWVATEMTREDDVDEVKKFRRHQLKEAAEKQQENFAKAKKTPTYHISSDGNVRACRARVKSCPYASEDHFTSKEEAAKALEKKYT